MKCNSRIMALLMIFQSVYAVDVINYSTLHDPTTPPNLEITSTVEQSKSLDLAMTFVSSSSKTAIINGDLYSIGSVVSGYKISSIEQNKVVLQSLSGGETITLVTKRSLVLEKKSGQNTDSRNSN